MRAWPAGAMEALQDCFECTVWDMFRSTITIDQHINVEEYAESVSAYIEKCVDDVTVIKNITTHANEKPWMAKEVQDMLKAQKSAFKMGDMVELRTARANLNWAKGMAKRAHGQKTQNFFQDPMNTRRIWQSIQAITVYKAAPPPCEDKTIFLNDFNKYFGRFEALNNDPARKAIPRADEQTLWT